MRILSIVENTLKKISRHYNKTIITIIYRNEAHNNNVWKMLGWRFALPDQKYMGCQLSLTGPNKPILSESFKSFKEDDMFFDEVKENDIFYFIFFVLEGF